MNKQSWTLRFRLLVAPMLCLLVACTDKKEEPVLEDLRAIPKVISIGDQFFYPKPFSIRAKYSDNTEKNITKRMTWVSEDLSLIIVNKKGEIEKTGDCLEKKCIVSLIATDPESGKSLRLIINISQKTKPDQKEKKPNAPENKNKDQDRSALDESEFEEEPVEASADDDDVALSSADSFIESNDDVSSKTKKDQGNAVLIQKLLFNENDVLLTSGEQYFPGVFEIDTRGQRNVSEVGTYECYLLDDFNPSVFLIPPCQLIGIEPGDIMVGVRHTDGQIDGDVLTVRVVPSYLNVSFSGFSMPVDMMEYNIQRWFQISGLRGLGYYRVLLNNVSPGYSLSVYTRSDLKLPTCVNTAPVSSNTVACYFQSGLNDIKLVVSNPRRQLAQGNVTVEPVEAKFFFHEKKLNRDLPVEIALDSPVSDFVFANDAGRGNFHYYFFEADKPLKKKIEVTLSGFSVPIQLTVTWPGGFCRGKEQSNTRTCRISSYFGGKMLINVDGNNGGSSMLNVPAAAFGGTTYRVDIKREE